MVDEERATSEEPSETEVKARETGWVPKEEWKGKSENWKPAQDWLERSNPRYVPALEKQIGALTKELAKQKVEFSDSLKRVEGVQKAALESQRRRIEEEFDAKILKATELGDTDAAKKALSDKKRDMTELADKAEAVQEKQAKKEAKDGGIPADVQEALEIWQEDNEWFVKDRRLRRFAIALYDEVEEDMPSASPKAKLAEVTKRVKEEFPSKFKDGEDEEEDTRRPARVEAGSRNGNGATAKKQSWGAIPREIRDEAKQVLSAFLKKGEKLDTHLADVQGRYAAEYWKDNAA